ncbi:Hsp20/alpha crystallin family protein [Halorientalis litorea]|jgi:HSP20 family molecular chaperone IbpA|uniref:Hsp20/alpha crystallin family protein n=1 Tax=Halorientalis litorea TaxID=2931977 RepID=UPI001FF30E7C|nr:Hsp20/alpha crystallin family protein [Halorientalis litorea]
MIRELGRSLGNTVLEAVGRASSRVQERRPLPVDLLESDDAYLAVFDAPGATSSDVQVRFDDDTVAVRIDRFREFREGYEVRLPGRGLSLDGEITLPDDADVDPNAATATLRENGSLEVRVPKNGGPTEMTVTEEDGNRIETTDAGDSEAETTDDDETADTADEN